MQGVAFFNMETGILNFHDEEIFATSIYDQGDLSGIDGRSSLLDMMHSDLQHSSDYLNQSAVHWDSDEEQEHNGDLAVLPVAPSECSNSNSSREDYSKALYEWQDSYLYQPLDPDIIDLRLGSQIIPSELPDNIFEDSLESNSSALSNPLKPSVLSCSPAPQRCSTPNLTAKESISSSDGSINLDMSLSGIDVNVSDIDVSALGINVSSLDIKSECRDTSESQSISSLQDKSLEEKKSDTLTANRKADAWEKAEKCLGKSNVTANVKTELTTEDDDEFSTLFGAPEANTTFLGNSEPPMSQISSFPVFLSPPTSLSKIENSDVEQLHDIAMEFIKEEQEAQSWENLSLLETPLDCNINLEPFNCEEVPVLEAGNVESLLEQFEATLASPTEFSQSMPASPAHLTIPLSSYSMPASPSSISLTPSSNFHVSNDHSPKISSLLSPSLSPSHPSVPNPPISTAWSTVSPAKGVATHQNFSEPFSSEVVDQLKVLGCKKAMSLMPVMPIKKLETSGTRMHAAGVTLIKNKLLKLVSCKGATGETVQFDHDYCSNESSSKRDVSLEKRTIIKKTCRNIVEWNEDKKSSQKDSKLESGEYSENTEGSVIPSLASSGFESNMKSNRLSILKPRKGNQPGRNKEMLMVSVLKKVRCDPSKVPVDNCGLKHLNPNQSKEVSIVSNVAATKCNVKHTGSLLKSSQPCPSTVTLNKSTSTSKDLIKGIEHSSTITASSAECLKIPVEISSESVGFKSTEVSKNVDSTCTKAERCMETPVTHSKPQTPEGKFNEGHPHAAKPEQPKKRKLNLEEYRNRQKAIQKERETKLTSSLTEVENSIKKELTVDENGPICQEAILVKEEPEEVPVLVSSLKPISGVDALVSKPFEDKRQHRQYRTRRLSSSSSESSPQPKEVCRPSERRKGTRRKALWSQSRSRSASSSSSQSRSVCTSRSRRSNSRSSSRSSSNSSSSGTSRSRSMNRSRNRRRNRSSCRSTSSSSRRSNSISSGSSWHSKHSSHSRRSKFDSRSRSRSDRRSQRTRSRSRSRSARSKNWRRRNRDTSRSRRGFRRSRSPVWKNVDWAQFEKDHKRQVEERRVIYVGRIPEDTTKAELRRRFEVFGPIVDISLHFREYGDNYGFVTFAYKVDAYEAVERGNDDPTQPYYELCFGGRRKFCGERYADLDGLACKSSTGHPLPYMNRVNDENSFDDMLREVQAKLQARKKR